MKRTYYCPKCEGVLNPGAQIILRAKVSRIKALILLSPEPGNYSVVFPDNLPLEKGDQVHLRCPVCQNDLTSEMNPDFAEIYWRTSDVDRGSVIFSKTYGEHATFFIEGEKVIPYGEDASPYYQNFFGEGRFKES